jgi:hypothetical protein
MTPSWHRSVREMAKAPVRGRLFLDAATQLLSPLPRNVVLRTACRNVEAVIDILECQLPADRRPAAIVDICRCLSIFPSDDIPSVDPRSMLPALTTDAHPPGLQNALEALRMLFRSAVSRTSEDTARHVAEAIGNAGLAFGEFQWGTGHPRLYVRLHRDIAPDNLALAIARRADYQRALARNYAVAWRVFLIQVEAAATIAEKRSQH